MVVSQGDVCWASLPDPTGSGPGFRRPVVVVQGDAFNASRLATVVVVPLTSNVRWASAPGNVLLAREPNRPPARFRRQRLPDRRGRPRPAQRARRPAPGRGGRARAQRDRPRPRSRIVSADAGVYVGSTGLSREVFGRHRGGTNSLDSCDFPRPGMTGGDRLSTLVMKGSPIRIRASAFRFPGFSVRLAVLTGNGTEHGPNMAQTRVALCEGVGHLHPDPALFA